MGRSFAEIFEQPRGVELQELVSDILVLDAKVDAKWVVQDLQPEKELRSVTPETLKVVQRSISVKTMLRERVQGLATGLQEIQTDDIVLGIKTALRERFVDGSKATRLVQYEQGEKDFEVAKSWDIYALGAIVLEMESPHVLRERPPSARLDDKWKNVIKVAQEYCGSAHCSILDMVITLEDLLETYETIRRKGRKRARVGLVEAEFRAHNLLANAEVAEFGAVRAIAEEELVAARAALDADTRW